MLIKQCHIMYSNVDISVPCSVLTGSEGNLDLYDFKPISLAQVYNALEDTDLKVCRSRQFVSLTSKTLADIIVETITYIFNLSLMEILRS